MYQEKKRNDFDIWLKFHRGNNFFRKWLWLWTRFLWILPRTFLFIKCTWQMSVFRGILMKRLKKKIDFCSMKPLKFYPKFSFCFENVETHECWFDGEILSWKNQIIFDPCKTISLSFVNFLLKVKACLLVHVRFTIM